VVAAIDARHGHVFLQVFGPGGHTIVSPRLARLSEAVAAASSAPACLVGSAARAVADGLAKNAAPPRAVDPREAPDIVWVAQIGAVTPQAQSLPHPQYLRAPDAQPQNAAQLPRR
jgi:tRNA threonylcarbamoyladenosine biosynthesis protein TsaB